MGDPLRDRAIGPAGTGARQVEAILRGPLSSTKGRLIDHRDESEPASKRFRAETADEQTDSGHRLELIAVDTAGDEQVRTRLMARYLVQCEFQDITVVRAETGGNRAERRASRTAA